MGYLLIRIISCMIIAIVLFVILKCNLKKFWISVISSIVAGSILCWGLYFIPIENYVYTFSSQENAISYVARGTPKLVLEGEESVVAICQTHSGDVPSFSIRKTDSGYKVYPGDGLYIAGYFTVESATIPVYRALNTNDYYLLGFFDESAVFSDLYDSELETFDIVIGSTTVTTYGGAKINYQGSIENYIFYLNGVPSEYSKSL